MEEAILNFLQDTWSKVLEYWLLLSTILSCTLMAMFRTAKQEGKVDYLEAGMCGLLSYGSFFVLAHFGLPEGAGVLLGGVMGYLGTNKVSEWISNKLGITSKQENGGE